ARGELRLPSGALRGSQEILHRGSDADPGHPMAVVHRRIVDVAVDGNVDTPRVLVEQESPRLRVAARWRPDGRVDEGSERAVRGGRGGCFLFRSRSPFRMKKDRRIGRVEAATGPHAEGKRARNGLVEPARIEPSRTEDRDHVGEIALGKRGELATPCQELVT